MKLYLQNLIPRIREFSATLDKNELFIDKPWVIIDENLNQQKYIFKRDGSLIMSLNGQVTLGKWEHIPSARSLLIDRVKDAILLNQDFINPAVMILKKDGLKDESFIMANELLIPNLDVTTYLRNFYYRKNNIGIVKLKNGEVLEINNYFGGEMSNNTLTIEGAPIPDGKIELAYKQKKYLVKDSRFVHALSNEEYETNKGTIFIEQPFNKPTAKGNLVYQDNKPAPDGKYKLGFLKNITVVNGRVV